MRNSRGDDYEYLGLLLEGLQGSLIEERREFKPKNYVKLIKRYAQLNSKFRLPVSTIIDDQAVFENRLAELAALFPDLQIDVRMIGIDKILGKDQYKKVKNLLICLSYYDVPEYLKFILETQLLKLVPKNAKEGIGVELQFLSLVVQMEKTQRQELLNKIYSKHNLKSQAEYGYKLFRTCLSIVFFPSGSVLLNQRKRGYNDKGSTSLPSEKARRKSMAEISKQIEERKQAILLKQMELFERNLDRILKVDVADSREEIKEIIRTQAEQIITLHQNEGDERNE